MLAVTEIVLVDAVAAVVAVFLRADGSKWAENLAVVSFQLLEQVENTSF